MRATPQTSITTALALAAAALLLLGAAPAHTQSSPSADPVSVSATVDAARQQILLNKITPSFSVAPRSVFRRRGPRGSLIDYSQQTVWLSANMHDLLPRSAARAWPSPIRLSVGRRGLGAGLPGEYVVGLDLDAARLPGTHPVWMHTKRILHTLRLPGPAIVMGPNGTRAMGLYW